MFRYFFLSFEDNIYRSTDDISPSDYISPLIFNFLLFLFSQKQISFFYANGIHIIFKH